MYSKSKTCCFTGHRPQKLKTKTHDLNLTPLKELITKEIENAIKNGYTHFISGFALGIDIICAEIVINLKAKYPFITLESAIPCETQSTYWPEKDREQYYRLLSKCDKETLISNRYTADCYDKRNKYMVDSSELVIAIYDGIQGGTLQTIIYALSIGKSIIFINPSLLEIIKIE